MGKEIIKGTRNKNTGMWKVSLGTKQSENLVNSIFPKTSEPELAQYLHAAPFSPITPSLLKAIKQVFLKTWSGLTEKLIKKHLEKSRNATMGHLHMIKQGYKPGRQYQNNYSVLQNCGPEHNQTRQDILRYMRKFPNHLKQGWET